MIWYSYKVNSNIARSGFAAGPITVERRYSDFSWLSSALAKEFPGAIIPPLPEKLTLGRFSSEFVESRRRALERFLSRILLHPDLGNAQSFCTFLQGDESSFGSAKDETKNANKQKLSSTTAMAWLEGTVNTLTVGKVSSSILFGTYCFNDVNGILQNSPILRKLPLIQKLRKYLNTFRN